MRGKLERQGQPCLVNWLSESIDLVNSVNNTFEMNAAEATAGRAR